VSDTAPRNYESNLAKLRSAREQVFSDLKLEVTEKTLKLFDRCAEWAAFEGTNPTIGRVKRLMIELGGPVE
jgi:hypothetical protein